MKLAAAFRRRTLRNASGNKVLVKFEKTQSTSGHSCVEEAASVGIMDMGTKGESLELSRTAPGAKGRFRVQRVQRVKSGFGT